MAPTSNGTPWWEWPDHERAAVRRFLWEYWLDRVDATTDGSAVDEALCAIGQAEPDLTNYLEALLDLPSRRLHVARLAKTMLATKSAGTHGGTPDTRPRRPSRRLDRWLATPAAQSARGSEDNRSRANGGV